jgi:hypothetical protein
MGKAYCAARGAAPGRACARRTLAWRHGRLCGCAAVRLCSLSGCAAVRLCCTTDPDIRRGASTKPRGAADPVRQTFVRSVGRRRALSAPTSLNLAHQGHGTGEGEECCEEPAEENRSEHVAWLASRVRRQPALRRIRRRDDPEDKQCNAEDRGEAQKPGSLRRLAQVRGHVKPTNRGANDAEDDQPQTDRPFRAEILHMICGGRRRTRYHGHRENHSQHTSHQQERDDPLSRLKESPEPQNPPHGLSL